MAYRRSGAPIARLPSPGETALRRPRKKEEKIMSQAWSSAAAGTAGTAGRSLPLLTSHSTTAAEATVALIGRLLMSAIFILSGTHKVNDWNGTAAMMEQRGMPAVQFFLAATIIVEVVGGFALLCGCFTRFSATIVFLYLIPVT